MADLPLQVGNVVFHETLPSLEDCLVRVGRMAQAFHEGTDELRDIRTADVIALVGDLRFRASVMEEHIRRAQFSVQRSNDG